MKLNIPQKTQKQNIGNAGEHYIASILSCMDFVVSITDGRNPEFDLFVMNKNNKTIKISVKALKRFREKKDFRFPLNKKNENLIADDLFYCFIGLNEFKKEPDFWIIPSKIVAKHIQNSHQKWLDEKNKECSGCDIRCLRTTPHRLVENDWEVILDNFYKEKGIKFLEDFK